MTMKKFVDTFLLSTQQLSSLHLFKSQANKLFDQELGSASSKLNLEFPQLANKCFGD